MTRPSMLNGLPAAAPAPCLILSPARTRWRARWLLTWHAAALTAEQRRFLCEMLTARKPNPEAAYRVRGWFIRAGGGRRMIRAPSASPRLALRDDLRDAEGQPRPVLILPGRKLPLAFPSIPAALAALRDMEAPHGR